MNLQPMTPSPFDAMGNTFNVFCARCGKSANSADVSCDLDAAPGTFYCPHCAVIVETLA